ncbi:MAG: metal ABC transporter solute-binding protein, Zn/Mn family [Solirubrobacteraceae bacterium]
MIAVRSYRLSPHLAVVTLAVLATGCGVTVAVPAPRPGQIAAVGAENQYASVIAQIGGAYVSVTAIMSNPNIDPHSFEASPSVAAAIAAAGLIVQNGLGYDSFMNSIESASPNTSRSVIDVARLLGLPDSTPNPHLWYGPATMPALAAALVRVLSKLQPAHAAYFEANEQRFDASLSPWDRALARISRRYPHAPVASTEPVADYLLQAAGTENLTPFALQADIMNGVDPAPQDVTQQEDLLSAHRVRVLVYNEQVTDSLTQTFLTDAKTAGIPVIGVYETMPARGYDYQSWMEAETRALARALSHGTSTQRLT